MPDAVSHQVHRLSTRHSKLQAGLHFEGEVDDADDDDSINLHPQEHSNPIHQHLSNMNPVLNIPVTMMMIIPSLTLITMTTSSIILTFPSFSTSNKNDGHNDAMPNLLFLITPICPHYLEYPVKSTDNRLYINQQM